MTFTGKVGMKVFMPIVMCCRRRGVAVHQCLAVRHLAQAMGLIAPMVYNSDGDELVFHSVRFPLATGVAKGHWRWR